MNTRAKFTCTSVRKYRHWNAKEGFLYEAEFCVVTGDNPENKTFFASTPSGMIKVSTVRDDLFIPGNDYYVEFVEVA